MAIRSVRGTRWHELEVAVLGDELAESDVPGPRTPAVKNGYCPRMAANGTDAGGWVKIHPATRASLANPPGWPPTFPRNHT